MSLSSELETRCQSKCELCNRTDDLTSFIVSPKKGDHVDDLIVLCQICVDQIESDDDPDANHWRCLNESAWSQVPAVQVMAYRLLSSLSTEGWAQDLLGMIYIDEATIEWAQSGQDNDTTVVAVHKDCNGHILSSGDTVVLIKDLNVKGANFVAKRGTAVRRISLVTDNINHIQGRVNDQTIIILTEFVKK